LSLLIEAHYLPAIEYMALAAKQGSLLIEQCENFEKSTCRNRCYIAGSNGKLMLSIPLLGGRQQNCLTRNVQIDNRQNWQKIHRHSIESAYRSTAYFEYYFDALLPFYTKIHKFLFDLNIGLLATLIKLLKANINLLFTESYHKNHLSPDVKDCRNILIPNQNPMLRQQLGFSPPTYYQVFAHKIGFLPNISIIDLLFALGPETTPVLLNSFN